MKYTEHSRRTKRSWIVGSLTAICTVFVMAAIAISWLHSWRGERVRQRQLTATLIQAVEERDAKAVSTVIAAGADVNGRRQLNPLPIEQRGWVGIADEVSQSRAGVEQGPTAIQLAAANGDEPAVRTLLAAGADPLVAGEDSGLVPLVRGHKSPLAMAALLCRPRVAHLLLAHGGDPNQPDDQGRTPLIWATMVASDLQHSWKDSDVASTSFAVGWMLSEELAQKGVSDNQIPTEIDRGYHRIIADLLANGADPALRDNSRRSAVDYAKAVKLGPLQELLRKHGRTLIASRKPTG